MKKTTKVILGITTLGVLATSALAYNHGKFDGCDKRGYKQAKMMKMQHQKGGKHILGTIMRLDLKDSQRDKIISILKDARKNIDKPSKAFTASEFDKKMFVKLVKEQKEARIEKIAQTIEKVYKVLDKEQKKELKAMLDKKEQFRGGKYCDKNCNDRG